MSTSRKYRDVEDESASEPLHQSRSDHDRKSAESDRTDSTTSLVLERLNPGSSNNDRTRQQQPFEDGEFEFEEDLENGPIEKYDKPMDRKARRTIWIIAGVLIGAWLLALIVYSSREYSRKDAPAHDPNAEKTLKAGKKITMDQVQGGVWYPNRKSVSWIASPDGTDGLIMSTGTNDGYVMISDATGQHNKTVLMQKNHIEYGGNYYVASKVIPSPDLKKVLVLSNWENNFRHSYFGFYWIFDVATQKGEPLWSGHHDAKCALAVWAPSSDKIAFVFENNIYLRTLSSQDVKQITKEGGSEYFHGVPDWVYEEEVLAGNSALWWSEDSKYFAFLRTNESQVPEYPVQYFIKRPSGKTPEPGLENYPEERLIKYPKAGAPNPVVDIRFHDVEKSETFSVAIEGDFSDSERLITEVVWAGPSNVLVRETNRESDVLKMVLVDVSQRKGKITRDTNITAIDGGWFEVSEHTKYIPADPANGRKDSGYIDTVVHEGYDHLAYFSPLDSAQPVLLTSGSWEVVAAPSAVDLKKGLVYYQSTERSPIERHFYSVKLDGTDRRAITNTSSDGYYHASFSSGAGYALLSYEGPGIPWQKIISTDEAQAYSQTIETNAELTTLASQYELPTFHYSTVNIDGFDFQVVERRPPHFNPKLKYPVIFHVYGGPMSQTVNKEFKIDFQAYLAAGLGYICVTVDGRGTGFIGRKARSAIRGNLGHYESRDQIETAKIWAKKKYVDEKRIAIWGWSFGGFTTLKVLEQDAGQTFRYGMAVAPVTDWSYYDSIYTERYMHTPQHNPDGYYKSAINNVTAMSQNVRFLIMHGVADDNVHFQNSLTLLDKLDQGGIENYDVHVFPDSDHSIYFHNANRMVYDKLRSWLIQAFNGDFVRMENEEPVPNTKQISDKAKV